MNGSWSAEAGLLDEIRHLPPDLEKKIRQALDWIVAHPRAGKELDLGLRGVRSYRTGSYRILYQATGVNIRIMAIGHRKNIYERFTEKIRKQN